MFVGFRFSNYVPINGKLLSVLDEECSEIELGQVALPSARCQAGLMCMGGHCKEYSNVVEVTEAIIV